MIAIPRYPPPKRAAVGKRDSPGGIAFLSVFGAAALPRSCHVRPDERRRADPPFRPGHRRRGGSGSHLAIDSTRLELGVIRIGEVLKGSPGAAVALVPCPAPDAPRSSSDLRFKRGDAGVWFLRKSTRASPGHSCLTIPSVSLPAHRPASTHCADSSASTSQPLEANKLARGVAALADAKLPTLRF